MAAFRGQRNMAAAIVLCISAPVCMAVQRYVSSASSRFASAVSADEKQASSLDDTVCDDSSTLFFRNSMLQYSNLGGHGPDTDFPGSIRISDVMPYSGVFADMVITAEGPYYASSDFTNKVVGSEYVSIGVNSGSSTILRATFKDRVTDTKVTVPSFTLSFVEFAHMAHQGGELTATICNHSSYITSADTWVSVQEAGVEGCSTIGSASETDSLDLPPKALSLKPHQLNRVVTFQFGPLSEFFLNLTVAPGMRGGRFVFAGSTNLACPERALCSSFQCPNYWAPKMDDMYTYCDGEVCTEAMDRGKCCDLNVPKPCGAGKSLLFPAGALNVSNLDNDGPMFGSEPYLWFHNVFPFSGDNHPDIDLRVRVSGIYEPANVSLNGQHGNYGSINVADNTQVDLTFEFFVAPNGTSTGRQRTRLTSPFYFSVLDFDMQDNGGGTESIAVTGFDSYSMTNTSSIAVSKDHSDRTVFTATQYGTESDNPRDPLNLTREQLDKSVTILYPAKTDGFSITMKVRGGFDGLGRNFLFSGWTEVVCPRQALCMTYECPLGKTPKSELLAVECEGLGCYNFDESTCCEEIEPDVCEPRHLMNLMPGAMVINNLGGIGPDADWADSLIRVSDTFPFRLTPDTRVDLVVTAPVYRAGAGCQNRIEQGFLKLCLALGSSVHLNFTFIDRITNEPAEQRDFAVTMAHFLHDAEGGAAKSVEIYPVVGVNSSDDSRVGVAYSKEHHRARFTSQPEDPDEFPPSSPYFLNTAQKSRTAAAIIAGVSSFHVKLTVGRTTPPPDMDPRLVKNYREFWLAGTTSLSCNDKRSCGSFTCPARLKLKQTASNIICRGEACSTEECCMPDDKVECLANTTLNFTTERMTYHEGHSLISLPNVFPLLPNPIDLELQTRTKGVAGIKVNDPVLAMTMNANTCTEWTGRLMNRRTGGVLRTTFPFWLTFFNMQTKGDGSSPMSVASEDYTQYHLIQSSSLLAGPSDLNPVSFRASVPGHKDFVGHTMSLTDEDLHKTLALQFNSSLFHIQLCVGDGTAPQTFMLGGQSNLICPRRARCDTMVCPANYELRPYADHSACKGAECTDEDLATCCQLVPCSDKRILSFASREVVYSNLAGQGPDNVSDEAMLISNVFPEFTENVDLLIRALGHYYPNNVSRNGLYGEFLNINIKAGTHASFHFQFLHHSSKTPIRMPTTLITFADIDKQKKEGEETVSVAPFVEATTSFDSAIRQEEFDAVVEEHASTPGSEMDNPQHPLALSRKDKDRSVTYLLPEGSEFWVNLSVTAGWEGRNFLFAGASNLNCPARQLCDKMNCPVGTTLHELASTRACHGAKCDVHSGQDVLHCCTPRLEAAPSAVPGAEARLQYFAPTNKSVPGKADAVKVEGWVMPAWGKNGPAPQDRDGWESPMWSKQQFEANLTANATGDATEGWAEDSAGEGSAQDDR